MSTSYVSSPVSVLATGVWNRLGSPPAWVIQSVTAVLMAMLVTVAEVTLSTARDWAATMAPGRVSMGEVLRA